MHHPLLRKLPGVDDVKNVGDMLKNELLDGRMENYFPCPRQCDTLVIGGKLPMPTSIDSISSAENGKLMQCSKATTRTRDWMCPLTMQVLLSCHRFIESLVLP